MAFDLRIRTSWPRAVSRLSPFPAAHHRPPLPILERLQPIGPSAMLLSAAVRRSCLKRTRSPSNATTSTTAPRSSSAAGSTVHFAQAPEIIEINSSDDEVGDRLSDSDVEVGDDLKTVGWSKPMDAMSTPMGATSGPMVAKSKPVDAPQFDPAEIGKKIKTKIIAPSGIAIWKTTVRRKKAWYDQEDDFDFYEDVTDGSGDEKGDILNLGDAMTVDHPDLAAFTKLAKHLGGLTINVYQYEAMFGRITRAQPFGETIWHGMATIFQSNSVSASPSVVGYPYMRSIYAEVPWLGYFVSPEKFSKSTSAAPVSASAPARTWTVDNAYPAIFVLTLAQHKHVESYVLGSRPTQSPSNMDFYEGIRLDGKSYDVKNGGDGWSKAAAHGPVIIEFDARTFGGVYLICLKILIAGIRPWTVDASRMRLYKPLSCL